MAEQVDSGGPPKATYLGSVTSAHCGLSIPRVAAMLFCLCLASQFYLIFAKSFNWDEFIHFSQVYQLKGGNFIQPFQVFHLRLLGWATEVSDSLLIQMRVARLFMWTMNLLTLASIFGIASRFTSSLNAFYASFAYLAGGYVFAHAFSVRADPFVTAILMAALFLVSSRPLTLAKAVSAGALVGLAGMMTVKSGFYAPCFAGLLWWHYCGEGNGRRIVGIGAAFGLTALAAFAAIYLYHTSVLTVSEVPVAKSGKLSSFARWLNEGVPFAAYIAREIVLAPMFFVGVMLAPIGWRKSGMNRAGKVALAGFAAPLLVLFFYRNTFPYFFVFLLAPVSVAIAPALGLVRQRYGDAFLSAVLAASPIFMAIKEPRDVIAKQQVLVDYVHREFPTGTHYLDYSAMIADYPRILTHLTSGNGIRFYRERGDPVIAREIHAGKLPFIISNHEVIQAALEGRPFPDTFLPADLAAMRGNYVRQWGALWREGKNVPAGAEPFTISLPRGGAFVLAGPPIVVDGMPVRTGMRVKLGHGNHHITGPRLEPSVLWRGERMPTPPPATVPDEVFTNF